MKWLSKIDFFLNEEFENPSWADELNTDQTVETFKKNLRLKI